MFPYKCASLHQCFCYCYNIMQIQKYANSNNQVFPNLLNLYSVYGVTIEYLFIIIDLTP